MAHDGLESDVARGGESEGRVWLSECWTLKMRKADEVGGDDVLQNEWKQHSDTVWKQRLKNAQEGRVQWEIRGKWKLETLCRDHVGQEDGGRPQRRAMDGVKKDRNTVCEITETLQSDLLRRNLYGWEKLLPIFVFYVIGKKLATTSYSCAAVYSDKQ